MIKTKRTKAVELSEYGITLGYLAGIAGRKVSYVKLWSCGAEASEHLDTIAARLIKARQREMKHAKAAVASQ